MKLVLVNNLKAGLCLAKSVYDSFGRVLLSKGTMLTDRYISHLKNLEYSWVYIDDGVPEADLGDDIISQAIRAEAIKKTKEEFLNVKSGNSVQERKVKQAVSEIIDEILSNRQIMIHLVDIRSMQDYIFSHSVNVCILSMMTGISMGYNQLKLKELGIGAILHDIGKMVLSEERNNLNQTTQGIYQQFQKHCDYGFEILRRTPNIGIVAAHAAWQHHECYNGTGYPRKLAGKAIQEFARIVSVADTFDNLTNDRPGQMRISPHEAIEMIRSRQGIDFDPDIVAEFLLNIAPYPTGSLVLLNDGSKATVVNVNRSNPMRPKVKLSYDDDNRKIEGVQVIDLTNETSLFIKDVVTDL